ncbi:MAG TPA: hypothetical protein VHN18_07570, partial [Micromonosporaceae bacterium]|nr:hypothetical protein [Micromonosporaceae bacterium]
MEGTERGLSRPAEPAPRWRSLLSRARLRQPEQPEVVDQWLASIKPSADADDVSPADHGENGASWRSPPGGYPAEDEYASDRRDESAFPGYGSGRDEPVDPYSGGRGYPEPGPRPPGETAFQGDSPYAALEPGYEPAREAESRYAALEPGYGAPPPVVPASGAPDHPGESWRPQPWREPAGSAPWAAGVPEPWAEQPMQPPWAEAGEPARFEPASGAPPGERPRWAEPGDRSPRPEVPNQPRWAGPADRPRWAGPADQPRWAEPADQPRWAEPDHAPWSEST